MVERYQAVQKSASNRHSAGMAADPFPDLPELLTTRQQIASVLGYSVWNDRCIRSLMLSNGCPIVRLPGEGRKGKWMARKSSILAWLENRLA